MYMNKEMRNNGAALAIELAKAYDNDDEKLVIAHMKSLAKSFMPLGFEFWADERCEAPIMIDGELPSMKEFVLMSASDSHGRHNPNELYATANAIKNSLKLSWDKYL